MRTHRFFIKSFVITIGTLIIILSLSDPVSAEIVLAKSCSRADVQKAIDSAQDGDTILVPAGNCQWSQPVTVGQTLYIKPLKKTSIKNANKTYESKNMIIKGSGVGKTNIANISTTTDTLFTVVTVTGKSFRLTGFTFSQPGGAIGSRATIEVFGTGKSTRIDHNKFTSDSFAIYYWNDQTGVIDHNDFTVPYSTICIKIFHDEWDGYEYGDGSWASPLNLGGSRAVFIEDNTFTYTYDGISTHKNAWAVDASEGGRYVFRYNTMNNMVVSNHGSDTGKNRRGTFSYEIYGNKFERDAPVTFANAISLRGGTGVIWGNTATGLWGTFATASTYRKWSTHTDWAGGCNGEGAYDLNDGAVYATGTHQGLDSGTTAPYLYDPLKSWPTNTWTGYSIINITTGENSYIKSNTTNTIMIYANSQNQTARITMRPGDGYKIMKPLACVDQVGRGTGDLLSGRPPTPVGWPHQALEPVYVWNNTLNSGVGTLSCRENTGLVEGVDFINGKARPGYSPFIYPHPLNKKEPKLPIVNEK